MACSCAIEDKLNLFAYAALPRQLSGHVIAVMSLNLFYKQVKFGRDIHQVLLLAIIFAVWRVISYHKMYAKCKNENITLDRSFTSKDSFQQAYSLPGCIFVQFSDFARGLAVFKLRVMKNSKICHAAPPTYYTMCLNFPVMYPKKSLAFSST